MLLGEKEWKTGAAPCVGVGEHGEAVVVGSIWSIYIFLDKMLQISVEVT
jgi:hypothetical protein